MYSSFVWMRPLFLTAVLAPACGGSTYVVNREQWDTNLIRKDGQDALPAIREARYTDEKPRPVLIRSREVVVCKPGEGPPLPATQLRVASAGRTGLRKPGIALVSVGVALTAIGVGVLIAGAASSSGCHMDTCKGASLAGYVFGLPLVAAGSVLFGAPGAALWSASYSRGNPEISSQ